MSGRRTIHLRQYLFFYSNFKSHEIASSFSLCFKLLLLVDFYTENFYRRKVSSPVTEVQELHSMPMWFQQTLLLQNPCLAQSKYITATVVHKQNFEQLDIFSLQYSLNTNINATIDISHFSYTQYEQWILVSMSPGDRNSSLIPDLFSVLHIKMLYALTK